MNTKRHESEVEIWHYYFGGGQKSVTRRKKANAKFSKLFGNSVIDFMHYLRAQHKSRCVFEGGLSYLNNIHPDAWDIILRYGVEYKPVCHNKFGFHNLNVQPEPARCYANTYSFMDCLNSTNNVNDVVYVEGIAYGIHVKPMLHAWNGLREKVLSIDWTFYACAMWTQYFGVSFTQTELDEMLRKNANNKPIHHLIFRKEKFERVRDKVLEILKRRS